MNEREWTAEQFEASRVHLRSVAYRMLGSGTEADDAVQEAWLRLNRSGTGGIENLRGWLTTVVGRVCIDMLRSRRARREAPLWGPGGRPSTGSDESIHPEAEALLADSVGEAMLVVLETLSPAERLAFVLHDMFDLPFDEIAPIVGRSPIAARQLASRARRRVRGASIPDTDAARKQKVVEAFLAASRGGQFDALLALLDPDVVLRADPTVVQMGQSKEFRGALAVIDNFSGRARAAKLALVNGAPGAVWAPGGRPRVAFGFKIKGGKIAEIDLIGDPERLGRLDLVILNG
jgi:RNA polymerase sigma factor (sigma-70 family)